MKKIAAAISLSLVLFLGVPAFAQPFADVPTDHWAYDAIAELAAKGLIEGYPDGTFKGDRAMTRYEAAMIVARLLARVEAIAAQIPPPAPRPEVGRADLNRTNAAVAANARNIAATTALLRREVARLERLIRDFSAELTALGVRVNAIEDELQAIKAKLDNTKVTGNIRFRFEARRFPLPDTAGVNKASNPTLFWRNRIRTRVQFVGQVSPQASATVRLSTHVAATAAGGPTTLPAGISRTTTQLNASSDFPGQGAIAFDKAHFDIRDPFGIPVSLRIGRQQGITLGPIGLLLNTDDDAWGQISNFQYSIDAAVAKFRLVGWNFTTIGARVMGGANAGGWDLYAGRAEGKILGGDSLTLGLNYVRSDAHGGLFFVTWDPLGFVSQTAVLGGPGFVRADNINGDGWGADIQWAFFPGVNLVAEWAQWNHTGTTNTGVNQSGYEVRLMLDLAKLGWVTPGSPVLTVGYQNFNPQFTPWFGGAEDLAFAVKALGDLKGFNFTLAFKPWQKWNVSLLYASGEFPSNGRSWSEYDLIATYPLAAGTELLLRYIFADADTGAGKRELATVTRVQLLYSW
ncbi:MAG: S-layer homology domain-containing protein [Armatimonadetes bacterium]|nr:S-layer homology domain-containing protein [Armatimonadota bacterium]